MEELTDRDAIARSLAEPECFMVIFERHYETIARYLARRLPPERAAELASETFTRAFAARARFDGSREDALPFLYGIAANLIQRHRRSEVRMLRAYARVRAEPAASPPEPADSRALAGALAALTPDEREVLFLFAWADLEYEQIAHALEIPVGTVRSRLHRARARLRGPLSGGTLATGEALDG